MTHYLNTDLGLATRWMAGSNHHTGANELYYVAPAEIEARRYQKANGLESTGPFSFPAGPTRQPTDDLLSKAGFGAGPPMSGFTYRCGLTTAWGVGSTTCPRREEGRGVQLFVAV